MRDDWEQNVMDAVDKEDGTQLQQLLQSSDQRSLDYRIGIFSPLTKAVCDKSCSIIERLLFAGAGVDYPDANGETPLMTNARCGNIHKTKLLLQYGANVNMRKGTKSVLCYHIIHGKISTIELLLEHGAQMIDPAKELRVAAPLSTASPLSTTVQYKLPCILKIFLDHSDKINLRLPLVKLFHSSLCYRSEECAFMILQHGCYPKSEIPNISNLIMELFYSTVCYGLTNLMNMLVGRDPYCFQSEWLIRKKFPPRLEQNTDLLSMMVKASKQPPNLTQLCKSVILAQLEYQDKYYLRQRQGMIDELPLPTFFKTFLKKM